MSGLATLDLPLTCADATLRVNTVPNTPYAITTGHDGRGLDVCTYDVGVTSAREIADYYRDGWHHVS